MRLVLSLCCSALLLCALEIRAIGQVLEEMPSVDGNGLRLYASAHRIVPTIFGPAEKEWATHEQRWVVDAYVKNIGNKRVVVLLGTDDRSNLGFEYGRRAIVSYLMCCDYLNDDIALKRPLADYRPVDLEPGECAELPRATISIPKGEPLSSIRVIYSADEDLVKWYGNVWLGRLEVFALGAKEKTVPGQKEGTKPARPGRKE